jgi:DNA-binding NarL/FixJ family response regulator
MLVRMPRSCLIVDDNASFLEASRSMLERQGITVAGVATSIADALQRAQELEPELILVDIDLGEESGFDLARRLAQGRNQSKVILISAHREDDFVDMVEASPAVGFLSKSQLSAGAVEALLRSAA